MADINDGNMPKDTGGDSKPVPDPTVLTTEALRREVAALKELIVNSLFSVRELLESKITTTAGHVEDIKGQASQARKAIMDDLARVQELADAKHTAMMNELNRSERERDLRFNAVDNQFNLQEEHRIEQKHDCVEASTPVLCADLIWRPAGSLVVGDELIGCDEGEAPVPGTRGTRMFRRATVTANSLAQDELLQVDTDDGNIRCNAHHPFLTKRAGGAWYWARTDALRVGDFLCRPVDVWEVDQSWDAGWIAGIIDGEGCLTFDRGSMRLSVVQRESDTMDRIEAAFRRLVDTYTIGNKIVPEHCQPQKQIAVQRAMDVMRIVGTVRPPRMLERSDQIWEGKSISRRGNFTQIRAVTPVGEGTIAELSTSTKTYIAHGFIAHNTQAAVDAALAAAKEAVNAQTVSSDRSITKSETATSEQLKQMNVTTSTAIAGINLIIDDVKERINRIESFRAGGKENSTTLIAVLGVLITLALLTLGVATFVSR